MIGLPGAVRIRLFTTPVDMRKGFDGLGALVRAAGEELFSGHLFVFLSKRRDRAKILTFQRGGFVLWYKRLEQGCFRPLDGGGARHVDLDPTALAMLLDGIDLRRAERPALWTPRKERIDRGARL